jgi:hypothetical protein
MEHDVTFLPFDQGLYTVDLSWCFPVILRGATFPVQQEPAYEGYFCRAFLSK